MNEDKLKHVNYIKEVYFSKDFLAKECKEELMYPKHKDLIFGFINGDKKTMCVYDEESKTRLEF